MKKIISIISISLFIFTSSWAQNDAIERFFNNYEDSDDFASVYVSPRMFEMVAKVAGEEMEGDLAEVVRDLKGLQILKTEVEPLKYYNEAKSKLPMDEYELLVKVKEEKQNVRIFSKSSGDIIDELLVLVGGSEEFILMSFVGKIDVTKLAKLAKSLDIDGANSLELLAE